VTRHLTGHTSGPRTLHPPDKSTSAPAPGVRRRELIIALLGGAVASACSSSSETPSNEPGEALDVSRFGANGDGREDETAAIQRALDDARSSGAVVTFVRGRVYRAMGLDSTGCRIDLNGATLRVPDSEVAHPIITAKGATAVSGGTLDGNAGGSFPRPDPDLSCGISIDSEDGWSGLVHLAGLTIVNTHGHGIRAATGNWITDSEATPASDLTIEDVAITGGSSGILLHRIRNPVVRDCTVKECSESGVRLFLTFGAHLSENTTTDCGQHGFTVLYSSRTMLEKNSAVGCALSGIAVGGGSADLAPGTHYRVVENVCTSNSDSGITCDPTVRGLSGHPIPVYGVVADNSCGDNGIHGIVLTCAAHMNVRSNDCTSNRNSGIALATAHTKVSRNTCEGNSRYGIAIYGNPSRPRYGWHEVINNHLAGNDVANINIESAVIPGVNVSGD